MPEASDTQGILHQNLIDAGCKPELAKQCLALAQEDDGIGLLRILSRHRRTLLDAIHLRQKQMDCLDYLVYRTEKKQHAATMPKGKSANTGGDRDAEKAD